MRLVDVRRLAWVGGWDIDATTKIPSETEHDWGSPLESDPDVAAMVERRWAEYGLFF